jgi:hypothetical protein
MTEGESFHGHESDFQFTQRFLDAIELVDAYNKGNDGLITRRLDALIEHRTAEATDQSPNVPHLEEAAMSKEVAQVIITDELSEMGIALTEYDYEAQNNRPHITPFFTGYVFLIARIDDADRFADTLYRLMSNEELRERTETAVAGLLETTMNEIRYNYPTRNALERMDSQCDEDDEAREAAIEQVNLFLELNPALVSQGFADSEAYTTLAEYAARYAEGTFFDYRLAEEYGLWFEGNDKGPSSWVMNNSRSRMAWKWNKVFGLLQNLRDRAEPSPLYNELFHKLRADFDRGSEWLDSVPTITYSENDERERLWADNLYECERQTEAGIITELERPDPPGKAYITEEIGWRKELIELLAKTWEEKFPLESAIYLTEKQARSAETGVKEEREPDEGPNS